MSYDPNSPQGGNPEGSYNAPQNPYGTPNPTQYVGSTPGYGQQPNHGFAPQAPRPLGQAVGELPQQYIKTLTKPSLQTFDEEQGKAAWNIVWVQLLILAVLVSLFGYLALRFNSTLIPNIGGLSTIQYENLRNTTSGSSFSLILGIPISFFIGQGITYLIAKAFGGQGTFLRQGYTYLLYYVPITTVSTLLGIIPVLGSLLGAALSIYGIVLEVFSIQAVHRLSGGKATLVVLLPVIIAVVLGCVLFLVLGAVIAAALAGASR